MPARSARAAACASRAGRGSRRRSRRRRAAARSRPSRMQRVAERRRRRAASSSGSRCSACEQPEQADARPVPAAGRAGSRRRTSTTPSRLPRRVAMCPMAIATPSATSALRRSAVPNCIDGDVSSTSQVDERALGELTRTCGCPVRAVTFHSILRTSSPGLVRADLRELDAVAVPRRAVVAGEHARQRGGRPRSRARAAARAGSAPGPGRSGVGDPSRAARCSRRAPAERRPPARAPRRARESRIVIRGDAPRRAPGS